MSIELKIILSAAAVIGLGLVIWLILMLKDGRRLRGQRSPEAQRRVYDAYEAEARKRGGSSRSSRVERAPYKREASGSSPDGTKDDTQTWPGPEQPA